MEQTVMESAMILYTRVRVMDDWGGIDDGIQNTVSEYQKLELYGGCVKCNQVL